MCLHIGRIEYTIKTLASSARLRAEHLRMIFLLWYILEYINLFLFDSIVLEIQKFMKLEIIIVANVFYF